MLEFDGKRFEASLESDLDRDGMRLALRDTEMEEVAEVFYSDVDATMTLTTFQPALPLQAAEWLIAQAKVRLPPTA